MASLAPAFPTLNDPHDLHSHSLSLSLSKARDGVSQAPCFRYSRRHSRLVSSSVLVPTLVSSIVSQLVPRPSSSYRVFVSLRPLAFSLTRCPSQVSKPRQVSPTLVNHSAFPFRCLVCSSSTQSPDLPDLAGPIPRDSRPAPPDSPPRLSTSSPLHFSLSSP